MKKFLCTAGVLGVTALGLTGCDAFGEAVDDEFPSQTITIYVPYNAGGPSDTMARAMATHFEDEFDQTVIVENQPGASGGLSIQSLKSNAPDGHSLGVLALPAGATNPMIEDLGYDNEDFRMVAGVIENAPLLAVSSNSDFTNNVDFFEYAKKSPGELRVAVNGATSSQAMELIRLREEHGVDVTAVPFDGNAESLAALLGNNVDAFFLPNGVELMSSVDSGDIVPIAIGTPERVDYLEGVPTLNESGFEGLDQSVSIFGFVVDADTPDELVIQLESAVETALEDEEIISILDPRFVPEEFIDADGFEQRRESAIETYSSTVELLRNK